MEYSKAKKETLKTRRKISEKEKNLRDEVHILQSVEVAVEITKTKLHGLKRKIRDGISVKDKLSEENKLKYAEASMLSAKLREEETTFKSDAATRTSKMEILLKEISNLKSDVADTTVKFKLDKQVCEDMQNNVLQKKREWSKEKQIISTKNINLIETTRKTCEDIENTKQLVDEANASLEATKERIKILTNNLAENQKQKADISASVIEKTQNVNRLMADKECHMQKIFSMREEIMECKLQIKAEQDKIANFKIIQMQRQKSIEKLDDKCADDSKLKKECDELQHQITNFKGKISLTEKKIKELEEKISMYKQGIINDEFSIHEIKTEMSLVEDQIKENTERKVLLTRKLDKVKKHGEQHRIKLSLQRKEWRDEMNALNKIETNQNAELCDLEATVECLTSQLNEVFAENKSMDLMKMHVTQKHEESTRKLKDEVDEMFQKSCDLQSSITKYEDDIIDLLKFKENFNMQLRMKQKLFDKKVKARTALMEKTQLEVAEAHKELSEIAVKTKKLEENKKRNEDMSKIIQSKFKKVREQIVDTKTNIHNRRLMSKTHQLEIEKIQKACNVFSKSIPRVMTKSKRQSQLITEISAEINSHNAQLIKVQQQHQITKQHIEEREDSAIQTQSNIDLDQQEIYHLKQHFQQREEQFKSNSLFQTHKIYQLKSMLIEKTEKVERSKQTLKFLKESIENVSSNLTKLGIDKSDPSVILNLQAEIINISEDIKREDLTESSLRSSLRILIETLDSARTKNAKANETLIEVVNESEFQKEKISNMQLDTNRGETQMAEFNNTIESKKHKLKMLQDQLQCKMDIILSLEKQKK
eukprot:GSMAST32.ASY1.ANO1.522.1 assembled CDS